MQVTSRVQMPTNNFSGSLFEGTAAYYDKFRPGISRELAKLLIVAASECPGPQRLLDLGTGSGQVPAAIGGNFKSVICIDTDQDMLAFARRRLVPLVGLGVEVTLIAARAEEFVVPPDWLASLVTISRAFHWLDRELVLSRLDSVVAAYGAVAVFADRSFWNPDSDWKQIVKQCITDYLGPERQAGSGTYSLHDRPHADVLTASAFSEVEESVIPVRRIWTVDSVIGNLFSTSFASRAVLGSKADAFESDLRERLIPFSHSLVDESAFAVQIGRRPRR